MRASTKYLIPSLAAALLLSACGTSSSSSSASSSQANPPAASGGGSAAVVKTASNSRVGGTILVNAQGVTLYRLTAEQNGKFICTSAACVGAWHPLAAPSGSAPTGAVGSLGTVKRPDGTEQVTYKGMPLYTFVKDQSPGQTNGQGIKDVGTWTVVTTAAAKASPPAAPAQPAPASGGGYAY